MTLASNLAPFRNLCSYTSWLYQSFPTFSFQVVVCYILFFSWNLEIQYLKEFSYFLFILQAISCDFFGICKSIYFGNICKFDGLVI